jgi:hypothetical protein
MPCHLSPLKNISKNSSSIPHHLMPRHLSPLKNNSRNLRKSPHASHLFPLKNNSENSSSMSHHLSLLKNNSKNSPHHLFYQKVIMKIQGAYHITLLH